MSSTTVRFYFDYVSPNAYVAWTQLPAIAQRYGVVVDPVPVLFAALLDAYGRAGPAEVPAQMRWMWKNVFGVPTMLVGDEPFWGYDDFPYLERFLAGNDPIDPAAWRKWSDPPRPSAVRERRRQTF